MSDDSKIIVFDRDEFFAWRDQVEPSLQRDMPAELARPAVVVFEPTGDPVETALLPPISHNVLIRSVLSKSDEGDFYPILLFSFADPDNDEVSIQAGFAATADRMRIFGMYASQIAHHVAYAAEIGEL